ncbi:MAG: hypothetical protein ACPG31_13965, partial [Planctomycetota bacterium]
MMTLGSCGLLSMMLVACGPEQSPHAAHDAAVGVERAPVVVTYYTDLGQLYMEYPMLVVGQEARFLAHLTVLEDGAPVQSGKVRLEVGPTSAPAQVFAVEEPVVDGIFVPVGSMQQAGAMEARLVVDSPQLQAVFPLPE